VRETAGNIQASSSRLKILVYGAGAVGQGVGCLLGAAGHEIHLVLRGRYAARIQKEGLSVSGIFGDYEVTPLKVGLHESIKGIQDQPFDYVLITTKSYDTAEAVNDLRRMKDQHFIAVSMQNGCGNVELLAEAFGTDRSLGGRVITGFEISRPGHVRITVTADAVRMGGLVEGQIPESARWLSEAIRDSGIPCEPTPHLRRHLLAKLLYNCALNPLGAILGVHYGALAESKHTRAVMDAVVRETFSVISAMKEKTLWDTAEEYLNEFYGKQVPATYHHRPSMLQDIEHGKRTEVDALTGYVYSRGREVGVSTPVCATLSQLVRFREEPATSVLGTDPEAALNAPTQGEGLRD